MINKKIKSFLTKIQNYDIFKKKLIICGVLFFVFIILSIFFYFDLKYSIDKFQKNRPIILEKTNSLVEKINSETKELFQKNLKNKIEDLQKESSNILENFQTSSLTTTTTTLETSSQELK